jgi:hypothetical protein
MKPKDRERETRRVLGMGRKHPEHVTWPASAKERALLAGLQERTWPDGEWADLLRRWLDDGIWGEKR